MRHTVKLWITALVAAAVGAALTVTALPVQGQATAPQIPRTADGKPDLNGLWQALNTANWDIEAHTARPALAMRPGPVVAVPAKEVVALGAIGAVPSGVGVVVGGRDSLPARGAQEEGREPGEWLTRDPEVKCYQPGVPRATYMPFPFQIFQSQSAFFIAYEYAGAVRNIYLKDPGPPQVDSWMGQSWAAGTATRSSSPPTASTTRAGSTARATTTARR